MSKVTKNVTRMLTVAALALAFATPARTEIIHWNLNQFEFVDGGVANGFFDWDTVAQTSSNYDIIVSGGDTAVFAPLSYTDETTNFAADSTTLFFF